MAQRVLAGLGAVVIVLVAIVVRSAIDDDDGDAADPGNGGDGDLVLVCPNDADFAAACSDRDGIRFIVEPAAVTAERVRTGDLPEGADGWLTSSAWTEVVEARAPGVLAEITPVATTDVILAADADRTDAIRQLCEGRRVLECVGAHAGESWGTLGHGDPSWGALKVGFPSADDAVGLSALAAATSGYFGDTDFAANDFDASGLRGWLANLLEPSGAGLRSSPIGVLVTQVGRYSAVVDLRSAVGLPPRVGVIDAEPTVGVTAVLAAFPRGDRLPGIDSFREAFETLSWRAPTDEDAAPTLKPGVMAALHNLWTEVIR